MTVATEKTDAFLRYIRSAEVNKLKGKVCNETVYSNKVDHALDKKDSQPTFGIIAYIFILQ